ncbi:MAG: type VI secretion system accessory protein TagJ [Janthinobacterium lividum]
MNADNLLRAGDLDGARRALVEAVRRTPGDVPTRMFLFSLLAIAGEWDKARIQLTTLAQLSPEAQMLSVAYGQAIDAERERAAVFAGEAAPTLHVASDWALGLAEAVAHEAAGRADVADETRSTALDAAPDTPGDLDGEAFDWIADADRRFGPTFEAIVGGRYGWQPFDQIRSITSDGPRDLRDLVWYPVEIAFRDGRTTAALLPARYPGIPADPAERLARATGWSDGPMGQVGSGQRLWSLSTGEDRGLLSVRSLVFH